MTSDFSIDVPGVRIDNKLMDYGESGLAGYGFLPVAIIRWFTNP